MIFLLFHRHIGCGGSIKFVVHINHHVLAVLSDCHLAHRDDLAAMFVGFFDGVPIRLSDTLVGLGLNRTGLPLSSGDAVPVEYVGCSLGPRLDAGRTFLAVRGGTS